MAYMIEYSGQVAVAQRMAKQTRRKWIGAACLLAAAVVARYFWGEEIMGILIPGDDAVTVQAFSNLLSGIGEGEEFSECVTAFCREVIYGVS